MTCPSCRYEYTFGDVWLIVNPWKMKCKKCAAPIRCKDFTSKLMAVYILMGLWGLSTLGLMLFVKNEKLAITLLAGSFALMVTGFEYHFWRTLELEFLTTTDRRES